jgi:hypothetical protein
MVAEQHRGKLLQTQAGTVFVAMPNGRFRGGDASVAVRRTHRRLRYRASAPGPWRSHQVEYDYVVISRDVRRAFDDVGAILVAESLKRGRQAGLSGFVRARQAGL